MTDRVRPYVYLLPTVVILATFTYLPILRLGEMSVRAPGLGTSFGPWIGLSNYASLFHNSLFLRVFEQTCVYVFASVPLTMALALLLALMVNQKMRGMAIFRVLYYTPVVMPTVAAAALALWMFNTNGGVVDYVLGQFGIPPIPWFVSSKWTLGTLIMIAVWKNLGYYMIIYLAGLQALPTAVLDAARLDGARPVVRFFTVVFPLLRPTTFFIAVVALIGSFQVFDFVNLTTQGGPANASNVLVYFAYQNGFSYMQLGLAAAISLLMFAFVLAVLGLAAWAFNR